MRTAPRRSARRASEQYWQDRLAQLPAARGRVGIGPKDGSSLQTERLELALPREVGHVLHRFSNGDPSVEYAVLCAALALVCHRWTGVREIVLAGTNRFQTSNSPNVLVHILQVPGEWTFRKCLDAVRQRVAEDEAHSAYPFELLLSDFGIQP